ncbi:MAG: hypothetical protein WC878_03320 [Candidatus Paceibacterota bacterium]|jgi:hypothetical protein
MSAKRTAKIVRFISDGLVVGTVVGFIIWMANPFALVAKFAAIIGSVAYLYATRDPNAKTHGN